MCVHNLLNVSTNYASDVFLDSLFRVTRFLTAYETSEKPIRIWEETYIQSYGWKSVREKLGSDFFRRVFCQQDYLVNGSTYIQPPAHATEYDIDSKHVKL